MVECLTEDLRALVTPRINGALDCFLDYQDIYSNEAVSYAIAEISEHLVMTLTGGARSKRANRGFDIVAGLQRIEVKARFVGKYSADDVHFNFGMHSKAADVGYCLLWQAESNRRASLDFAIRAPMKALALLWNKGEHAKYYARPTVRQLRATLKAGGGISDRGRRLRQG
jgi:hypothetical protein